MIEIRPFPGGAGAADGQPPPNHDFPFTGQDDHAASGWGGFLAWDDLAVAPGAGFGMHAHRNMEIVTYVRQGALAYEDGFGNHGRTQAGDVQVMSAGTGIMHKECNLEADTARVFQIWLKPAQNGGVPQWRARPFPKGKRAGRFVMLASGFSEDTDALPIRAPARVLGATLKAGEQCGYPLETDQRGYLIPVTGQVEVDGIAVGACDGAMIRNIPLFTVKALQDSDVMLVIGP